jgi:hypothetical protein
VPHRNGNRPLVGPRPEVERAIKESAPTKQPVPHVQDSLRAVVCQRPFTSLAVAALAGVGAGLLLKALGNLGAKR